MTTETARPRRDPPDGLPDASLESLARPAVVLDSLRHSRFAVAVLFTTLGLLVGSWLSRIPDVKQTIGLSDAHWGVLATFGSLGSLTAMIVCAAVITRVGARRMALVGFPMLLLASPFLAASTGSVHLSLGMVLWGLAASLIQAPINSAGVVVERAYGRPIMSGFHAGFSLGTLAGALLGALAVHLGVTPGGQVALTCLGLAVILVVTMRWLPPDERPPPREPRSGRRRVPVTAQLVLLAVIGFCSALAEGTSSQWSGIYTSEYLLDPGHAPLVYAGFAGAMSVGRLTGDRVVQRLGRRRFLQTVPLIAAIGLAAGLIGGTTWSALVGFVCAGIGLSCVTPTVFGTAGNQPGVPSGRGITAVTIAAWPAFLAGPAVVGLISSVASLRVGLFVVVGAALLVACLARWVRVGEPADRASTA